MTASRVYDAAVIGAGVNGLCAAACLARRGFSVLLLERSPKIGGRCEMEEIAEGFLAPIAIHELHALDPKMTRDLNLARHGLKFAVRDLPTVGLRPDGRHLILTREMHTSPRSIAAHSRADAEAWPRFQREVFGLARAARALWWHGGGDLPPKIRRELDRLSVIGAAAWLDGWFETDALKAVLAVGSSEGGRSPLEPGSALALLWRFAQEMSGRQAAVAIVQGGPVNLAGALAKAAQALGVEIRTGAEAEAVLVAQGESAGVRLASGEAVAARCVLSSLSRKQTLCDLVPAGAAGFGETTTLRAAAPAPGFATVLFALDTLPAFKGYHLPPVAQFVIAERVEALIAAHASSRAGYLPSELTIEFVIPTVTDASLAPLGQHVLTALVRPLPVSPVPDLSRRHDEIERRVVAALDAFAPGLSRHIVAKRIYFSSDIVTRYGTEAGISDIGRLMSNWQQRVRTSIPGLFLCGRDAEPVSAVSGRAGRMAAMAAVARLAQ